MPYYRHTLRLTSGEVRTWYHEERQGDRMVETHHGGALKIEESGDLSGERTVEWIPWYRVHSYVVERLSNARRRRAAP